MVAVGSIYWYASETIPLGFLKCDGSQISRTDYSGLFNVIGTTFGSGDGSTTFALPNLQASFIRGSGTASFRTSTFGQLTDGTQIGSQTHYASATPVKNCYNVGSYYAERNGIGGTASATYRWMEVYPYNMSLTPLIKY